jgi:CubicO group peptidase (beta-lactamase class C family)
MAETQGQCPDHFAGVRAALSASLDAGTDVGASVAVFLGGEPVVDLWGGYADPGQTRPWERDTITNVFSTTKTMTALSALVLADRGELDFDAPVSDYWPEFKAAGKEGVLVRHLMGHTAGLPGWDAALVPEDLADWDKCTSLLAGQAPWWEPGSVSGYHAVTQGYLVGEVVRRITGVSLGTFFRQELAEPLGADFHIGLPAEHEGRISRLIPHPPPEPELTAAANEGMAGRVLANPPITGETSWPQWWTRAEIPAANGHGNARSVGLVQSVLANGGEVGGRRYLSEPGCRAVFQEQSNGVDVVLGAPLRFGLGYGLANQAMPLGPEACFWGGYGGSVVLVDQGLGLCVSYVMNRMEGNLLGDQRGANIMLAAAVAAASI